MKIEILNNERMIITPNTFTEIYAVKKFLEENKNIKVSVAIEIDETGVFNNENL